MASSEYNKITAVNSDFEFPAPVRDKLVEYVELNSNGTDSYYSLSNPRFNALPANHADKIEGAIALLASTVGECTLRIPFDVTLTRSLTWDMNRVSLDFCGRTINAAALSGLTAIKVRNSAATPAVQTTRRFENFRMTGPGETNANSKAFRFFSDNGNPVRDLIISGGDISGFHTGQAYANKSYLIRNERVHFRNMQNYVHGEGSSGGTNTDYGENITFEQCVFGSNGTGNGTAFVMERADMDVNANSCSFDFLQKIGLVTEGFLHLNQCHFELRGALTAPPFETGVSSYARIDINGGRLQHNAPAPSEYPPYWFKMDNPSWGGGISIRGLAMQEVFSSTHFLGTGPGRLRTSQIVLPSGTNGSGYGQGDLLTTRAQNRLIDPLFASASPLDAKITSATGTITSAIASADVDISIVAGKLRLTKKTANAASIAFTVKAEQQRFYSCAFTLDSHTGSGTFSLGERWIGSYRQNANGYPDANRSDSRPTSTWDVATLPGITKAFGPTYNSSIATAWPREAPPWATHYQVLFNVGLLAPGTYDFSEVIITDL